MSKVRTTSEHKTDSRQSGPFFSQEAVYPKLTVNSPNDRYEQEADAMANRVMRMEEEEEGMISRAPLAANIQRMCSDCEDEAKRMPLQRKSNAGNTVAPADLGAQLQRSKGGGSSLPAQTQERMGQAFGVDFSGVRVHTGNQAAGMSQSIQAKAFTHGSDIYFNRGAYQPGSTAGDHLLAHELTHVVQQGGAARTPQVQRAPAYWAPRNAAGKPESGDAVHNTVQHEMAKPARNAKLFTEAPVVNATAGGVNFTGRAGFADFYRSDNNKIVGVLRGNVLENLDTAKPRAKNRVKFRNKSIAMNFTDYLAPSVAANGDIENIDNAPSTIAVADLKPFSEGQLADGETQLASYEQGWQTVKTLINALPAGNRGGKTWNNLTTSRLTGLKIPAKYKFPTARGQTKQDLFLAIPGATKAFFRASGRAIQEEYEEIVTNNKMRGKMYVMEKDDGSGLYVYAYFPDQFTKPSFLQSLKGSSAIASYPFYKTLKKTVDEDIVGRLKDTSFKTVQRTALPGAPTKPLLVAPPQVVQRKKATKRQDKFDPKAWKKSRDGYEKSFVKKLKTDNQMRDVAFQSVLEPSYTDYNKTFNSGYKDVKGKLPAASTDKKKAGRQMRKLSIWTMPGVNMIGTFRKAFGKSFVAVLNGIDKVKEKLKKLSKKRGGKSFDALKAAIAIAFKIFKQVAGMMMSKVMDLLTDSFQRGAGEKLRTWIDGLMPEELQDKVQEVKDLQTKYEELAGKTAETWLKKLTNVGGIDLIALFEKSAWIKDKLDTISTIVSIVRWGARLVACASPPAVGCLWILLEGALNAAISAVIQTCWFGKKVFDKLKNWNFLNDLARNFAGKLIPSLNGLFDPALPKGMQGLFAPLPVSNINTSSNKFDCNESGDGANRLTKERRELYRMIEKMGEKKFVALMKVLDKRGAGPATRLTADRLKALLPVMDKVTESDLEKALTAPMGDVALPIREFLAKIQTLSPEDKARLEQDLERKRAREKAKADKAGAGEQPKKDDGKDGGGKGDGKSRSTSETGTLEEGKGFEGKSDGRFAYAYSLKSPTKKFTVGNSYVVQLNIFYYEGRTLKHQVSVPNVSLKFVGMDDGDYEFNPAKPFTVRAKKAPSLYYAKSVGITVGKAYVR